MRLKSLKWMNARETLKSKCVVLLTGACLIIYIMMENCSAAGLFLGGAYYICTLFWMTGKAMNKWMYKKRVLFSICSLNGTEIRQVDMPASRLTSHYLRRGETVRVYFFNTWTRFFPQLIWQRTAVTWSLVYRYTERKCPPEQSWSFSICGLLETHFTAALRCQQLVHH